jgi:hypothetical protein
VSDSSKGSEATCTNSWVNRLDDETTDPALFDPYDGETEPLPELDDAGEVEYFYLRDEWLLLIRDDYDDIYRCPEYAWELE